MQSIDLNPKQEEAVMATDGPILIIAGPGSGKTKVLIWRMAQLIKQGISPNNILAVTFTNKAAQEIKNRLLSLLGRLPQMPTTGTFHAICAQLLRRELNTIPDQPLNSKFTIYDTNDSLSLVKKILKELNISEDYFKPASVLEAVSKAKNELISVNEYQQTAIDYYPQVVGKIYEIYQQRLKQANSLDFDDLLMLMTKIFQTYPAILEKYQNLFKYIMIDEYQDTNHTQYLLVNLLAQKYQNICVIGDEAQSIYSWRGADISNIINFQKDYPNAKTILLEQNYRSTKNILEAAHAVICQNTNRLDKKLWTDNPDGQPIMLYQASDEKEEADFLISEILKLQGENNLNFQDFSIFFRTNAQSRVIEEAFLRASLPYKIIGGLKFYERKEIKDLIAYLRLMQNPSDQVSLERIINIPPRGIGKKSQNLDITSQSLNTKIKNFWDLITELQQTDEKVSLSEFINLLITKINYEKYLLDKTKEGDTRWENVQELFTVVKDYDHLSWPIGLNNFLEQAALLASSDEVETNKDLINLMTLHCAKGLEFPVVFITGCEEGIFPHSKSYLSAQNIEEERRLCYVGITRAKQLLYLTLAEQRNLYGSIYVNQPSRFINEIPEHLVKRLLI